MCSCYRDIEDCIQLTCMYEQAGINVCVTDSPLQLYIPCRALRDYTKWHFVQVHLPYLSADFTDALQAFNGIVRGT